MGNKGTKPTRTQCELLRKDGRFPDDYLYIGERIEQEDYKNQKGNKKSLDKDSLKKKFLRFRNRSEGFVIELEVS